MAENKVKDKGIKQKHRNRSRSSLGKDFINNMSNILKEKN
jgi:hypothetical protein